MRLAYTLLLATAALSCASSVASADGPYEPNETAAQVAGSLGGPVSAALETPQDVDWYRFYAKPQSQLGLLATLNGTCGWRAGTVTARVYDADGGYGLPVISLTLGYNYAAPEALKTADQGTFTSQAGHRYFIQVRQSLCPTVGYSLQMAPTSELTNTLQDTVPCVKARRAAAAARYKLYAVRSASKRAHGARRRDLRSRAELQQQQVAVTTADQTSSCARRPLDQYPFI
ncbi:MAG: hypothetical protein QOF86_3116 [Baekduia sp.]|jgi:hypothetical protein|nr:hypothetical protein [Baekduia sp.]